MRRVVRRLAMEREGEGLSGLLSNDTSRLLQVCVSTLMKTSPKLHARTIARRRRF